LSWATKKEGKRMASNEKFLVTVDKETGAAVKIEQVGPDGELTEVKPEQPSPEQQQVGVAQPMPQSVVINITMGGGPPMVYQTGGEQPGVTSDPEAPYQPRIPIGPIVPNAPYQPRIPIGPIVPNVPYQPRIPIGPVIANWPWAYAGGQTEKKDEGKDTK
jgi:hypothetical protein